MKCNPWVGGSIGRRGFPMLGTGKRGLSTYIKELFKNGGQGFFYDPFDLKTQYQDAAGTTIVDATGQPLGLMLDKRKGLVLGSERAVNGDFSNGSANWNVSGADATHIVTFADGKVRYQSDTISPVLALNQGGAVVTGKWYEVTINCSSYVSGSLKIDAGNGAQVVVSGLGTFKTKILASTNALVLVRNSPNVDLTIDSISVKELPGNHAYQTTSAARPIFRQKPILGSELVVNGTFDTNLVGWQNITNSFAWANGAAVSTGTQGDMVQDNICVVGKTYLMSFTVNGAGGAGVYVSVAGNDIAHYKNGSFSIITTATSTLKSIRFRIFSGNAATIDNVSLKEITGYRTDQNYIEYDGVDDKLITNLPAQLTNCTVLRAIPNVGTQVKYNQTLPMLYEDSTSHAGLVAINRALTRKEQLRLMDELDKRAGAVGFDTTTFKLFDGTKQGFWYDPNDLSTMFQDAAGTVPVTGAGQAVGLMLDKSKGLKLESNLALGDGKNEGTELHVVRSDGNGSVSELSLNTVNPLSGSKDVRFKLTSVSSAGGYRPLVHVRLSENPVIGGFYRLSFKYKVLSGEAKILAYHTGLGTAPVNQNLTGEGTFTFIMPYLGTQVAGPVLYFGESLFDMQMDDFEYRRIQGNHAYQSNAASRPLLQRNSTTGAYYLVFDGSDDFLVTNSIDFTATDKISLFAGGRKLSDAAAGMITELSTAATTNNGSFFLIAPNNTNSNNIGVLARGTVTQAVTAALVAPANFVSTARINIGGDSLNLRLNGTQVASNVSDQGTGNYGNYPLYIGRRGGTTLPFNGHIYSLIGVGRLATESETAAIEKFLAKQLGVTLP